MDPIFRALKLGAPLSVQASSTRVNQETFPLGSMVTYYFPARNAEVQANNAHVQGMSGAGRARWRCLRSNWFGTTVDCDRLVRVICRKVSSWATTAGC